MFEKYVKVKIVSLQDYKQDKWHPYISRWQTFYLTKVLCEITESNHKKYPIGLTLQKTIETPTNAYRLGEMYTVDARNWYTC